MSPRKFIQTISAQQSPGFRIAPSGSPARALLSDKQASPVALISSRARWRAHSAQAGNIRAHPRTTSQPAPLYNSRCPRCGGNILKFTDGPSCLQCGWDG